MADNIEITEGTGTTVATDDVAGVQFQVVKLDVGGDGLSEPVTSLAKETGGNLDIIAGAVSGTEMQVDLVGSVPAGTNIIGAVKRDTVNYTKIRKYYANTGAVTDGIIWSPTAGKKWVITDIIMTISAAATVTLEDALTTGDSVVLAGDFGANGGISTNLQTPIESEEADADLTITTTDGNVKITVSGYEV
jgi:hypothetical protein